MLIDYPSTISAEQNTQRTALTRDPSTPGTPPTPDKPFQPICNEEPPQRNVRTGILIYLTMTTYFVMYT